MKKLHILAKIINTTAIILVPFYVVWVTVNEPSLMDLIRMVILLLIMQLSIQIRQTDL